MPQKRHLARPSLPLPPLRVHQIVPKKGEGFPEDFVPFVDYDEPVNAKY